MTDYSKLIDAETWAFIERTNTWYPPETATFTIEQQRSIYDAMCREFFAGYPDGITAHDEAVDASRHQIPVRRYAMAGASPEAMILYFHGGGFVVGGLESHDDVCAELCARTGNRVISVDYRLSPEYVHPVAYDDALAAFHWVGGQTTLPIILCGDSAGGNLAAALAHSTRGLPRAPVGQLLIYPGLGGDVTKGSYVDHADAPMLTMSDLEFYRQIHSGGTDFSTDPTSAPLTDTNFSGLPRTIIITAECDPLASDGGAYRDAIRAHGGEAHWFNEPGLVHGYLRARHSVTRARESFSRIVEGLNWLAAAPSPFPHSW